MTKEKGIEERLFRTIASIPPIKESIEANLMNQPQIEIVELGTLRREGRAKQRITDNR